MSKQSMLLLNWSCSRPGFSLNFSPERGKLWRITLDFLASEVAICGDDFPAPLRLPWDWERGRILAPLPSFPDSDIQDEYRAIILDAIEEQIRVALCRAGQAAAQEKELFELLYARRFDETLVGDAALRSHYDEKRREKLQLVPGSTEESTPPARPALRLFDMGDAE